MGSPPDHLVYTGTPTTRHSPDLFNFLQSTITVCRFHQNVSAAGYVSGAHSTEQTRLIISTHTLLLQRGEERRKWGRKKGTMSLCQLGAYFQYIISIVLQGMYCSYTPGSLPPLNPNEQEFFSPQMISIQRWKMEKKAILSLVLSSNCMISKITEQIA